MWFTTTPSIITASQLRITRLYKSRGIEDSCWERCTQTEHSWLAHQLVKLRLCDCGQLYTFFTAIKVLSDETEYWKVFLQTIKYSLLLLHFLHVRDPIWSLTSGTLFTWLPWGRRELLAVCSWPRLGVSGEGRQGPGLNPLRA